MPSLLREPSNDVNQRISPDWHHRRVMLQEKFFWNFQASELNYALPFHIITLNLQKLVIYDMRKQWTERPTEVDRESLEIYFTKILCPSVQYGPFCCSIILNNQRKCKLIKTKLLIFYINGSCLYKVRTTDLYVFWARSTKSDLLNCEIFMLHKIKVDWNPFILSRTVAWPDWNQFCMERSVLSRCTFVHFQTTTVGPQA